MKGRLDVAGPGYDIRVLTIGRRQPVVGYHGITAGWQLQGADDAAVVIIPVVALDIDGVNGTGAVLPLARDPVRAPAVQWHTQADCARHRRGVDQQHAPHSGACRRVAR